MCFGADGKCNSNPHGDGTVPKAAAVKAYPLVSRYGVLWIWMGDAAKADAAQIPDFSAIAPRDGWAVVRGHLPINGHYELVTDNLLDLSHVPYLHLGHGPRRRTRQGRAHRRAPAQLPPDHAADRDHRHYFWAVSRNRKIDDPEIDKALAFGIDEVFRTQDEVFVSACQQRMGTTDLMSLKAVLLPGDAAAVRARRMLAARLAEES